MLIWTIAVTGLALTSLVLLLAGLRRFFFRLVYDERRRLVADTARAVVAEAEARDARRARAARGTRPGGSRGTQQRDEQSEAEPRQTSAEHEAGTRKSRRDVARGPAAGMRDAVRGLEQTISAEMNSLRRLVRNIEARIGQVEHRMKGLAELVHVLGRGRPLARLPAPDRNHLSTSRLARPSNVTEAAPADEQRRGQRRLTVPADPAGQQRRSYRTDVSQHHRIPAF